MPKDEIFEPLKDDPWPLKVLGRIIGTVTGWDQQDTSVFSFYNFKPVAGTPLKEDEFLTVDYENGKFLTYTDEGDVKEEWDIASAIGHLSNTGGND